ADAKLTGPHRGVVGDDTVQAERGKDDSDDGECCAEAGQQPFQHQLIGNLLTHGQHPEYRDTFVDGRNSASDGVRDRCGITGGPNVQRKQSAGNSYGGVALAERLQLLIGHVPERRDVLANLSVLSVPHHTYDREVCGPVLTSRADTSTHRVALEVLLRKGFVDDRNLSACSDISVGEFVAGDDWHAHRAEVLRADGIAVRPGSIVVHPTIERDAAPPVAACKQGDGGEARRANARNRADTLAHVVEEFVELILVVA